MDIQPQQQLDDVDVRDEPKDFPLPEYDVIGMKPMTIGPENMIIPQCCREGWDTCPHVPKKQKPTKKNIGL